MANIKSAMKRARQTEERTERNRMRRSRMRSSVRQAEEAIVAGDKDGAQKAMRSAESQLAKAGRTGLLHAKAASRKASRLAAKMKALARPE